MASICLTFQTPSKLISMCPYSLTFVLNGSGEFESLHTPTAPGGCQLYVQLLPNRQVAHFDFMTTMTSAIECIYPHCSLCIFFCEMIVYFKYWILRNLYMLCIQGLPVSDIDACFKISFCHGGPSFPSLCNGFQAVEIFRFDEVKFASLLLPKSCF